MPRFGKLIISCAISGSDVVPSQTPYLPITPDEIAEECFRARKAGASMVHLHAKDPKTAQPTGSLDIWEQILKKVKARCPDLVIGVTTGGALNMSIKDRLAVIPTFKPEICSMTPESVTNTLHHIVPRIKEFKHPWEKEFLESTYTDYVFRNSFSDMEYFVKTMNENGTKPEIELFSTSGLYNARYLVRLELLKFPLYMQFVLGSTGGTGAYPSEVLHLETEAARMFGEDKFDFSVIGVGYPRQYTLGAVSLAMGGHVRVGLEDNIFRRRGVLCKSNAEMVEDICTIAEIFDRQIATPDEAREMLRLKGRDKVSF